MIKTGMMEFLLMAYTMLLMGFSLKAQQLTKVVGMVMDRQSKRFIEKGRVMLEGTSIMQIISDGGTFQLTTSIQGPSILLISVPDFNDMRIPLQLEGGTLDLGVLFLEKDITMEKTDNLISLTDAELFDDDVAASSTGILQASRDLFLNRAAFDFGQAFFRVRGYDAQYGRVSINGIAMNRPIDGRPQWNHWGGLNDVTRNQQFTNGMEASDFSFGGILGTTNLEIRPSALRPGIRVSAAASNRTYSGRLMATYNSGIKKNGLGTLFSASRRWAKEGYINGTLYDAFSFLGAIEFHPDKRNSIQALGLFAVNRRGRSSAITEEVFELVGNRYNPYWGYQNGEIRNSRERKIAEPLFLVNHIYNSGRFNLNTGMAYQFGSEARSRLGYYNAPNPDPSYYRYLPSFYLNSPIGANFLSALAAKEGFIGNPQMQWSDFYLANKNGTAYVFYEDVNDGGRFSLNTTGNYSSENGFQIDFGLAHSRSKFDNYARIIDLLGAEVHEDIDPFSKTRNDLNSDGNVYEGSIFNYRYKIDATRYEAFLQLRWHYKKWTGFVAG
ncbi:MAG: TonB-dependent receptor, partial [Flavobacteriaceae bacterium]